MLVKAVFVFITLSGHTAMQSSGWEVKPSLCGMTQSGAYTPIGQSRVEGHIKIVCSK